MYVCICRAITDKQVEEAQRAGKSMKEICKSFGLGSECGSCLQDAIELIKKNHHQNNSLEDTSTRAQKKYL